MRFNTDWQAIGSQSHSRGTAQKAIARYTRGLLRVKVRQMLADYAGICLVNGTQPQLFTLRHAWFKRFENAYGLCFRAPNRQYKVSQDVQFERLEIMLLNTAAIRTLCLLCHGYDPEFENWDQSPFHDNEVGARECRTLAIRGQDKVPVVEQPNATHNRWTLCATTFSNQDRIRSGELPYAECMYRYAGDKVKTRLQAHIRSRGYPSWLSVTTSPSGSYREHDILDFLECHVPLMTGNRRRGTLDA